MYKQFSNFERQAKQLNAKPAGNHQLASRCLGAEAVLRLPSFACSQVIHKQSVAHL
jgi:hypothetical protein